MLDKNDRVIVEAIRKASRLKLVIDGDSEIAFAPSKALSHDIALAVQSHFNRLTKR